MPINHYSDQPQSFASFEQRLKGALQPVQPTSAFEEKLKRRISNANVVTLERETKAVSLLVLAGGILIGALAIIILRKLFCR